MGEIHFGRYPRAGQFVDLRNIFIGKVLWRVAPRNDLLKLLMQILRKNIFCFKNKLV